MADNEVYVRLTPDQVRILNRIEGGQHQRQLARLIDDALSVVASEIPTEQATDAEVAAAVAAHNADAAAHAAKLNAADLVAIDSAPSAGGSPTEALTFTGLDANDVILALTMQTQGANPATVHAFGAPGAGTLSTTFSVDPGAGAVVRAAVKKVVGP